MAEPAFGLAADEYKALASSIQLIVHCAALTRFGHEEARYLETNVVGTANVLRLAESCPTLKGIVHVSTSYVCGEWFGDWFEDDLCRGQTFGNPYEESKYQAELLAQEALRNGLPVTVLRPSIVVGTSTTGHIKEFHNMYQLLKVLTSGRLTLVPGIEVASFNTIPVDIAADLAIRLIARTDIAGQTFHLVNPVPLRWKDISAAIAEFPSLRMVRFVPPEMFDLSLLTPRERLFYERMFHLYESYTRRGPIFHVENLERTLGPLEIKPQGAELLSRLLAYCFQVGYFT